MWSASQLKIYRICPKKYYHQYILGEKEAPSEAQSFGILFHEAVQKLNDLNENLYPEEIVSMIKNLRATPEFAEIKIIAWEQKFKQKLGEFTFLGYIDAIGKLPNREDVIIELKSANSMWKEKEIQENIVQPTIYQKATGIKNIKYFIVGKQKNPKVQVINAEVELWEKVEQTCRDIINDFGYEPNAYKDENKKHNCFSCSLRESRCEAYF
jgi:CRISPR/Cas system-associated exonuclease Cas4 (RecB family)